MGLMVRMLVSYVSGIMEVIGFIDTLMIPIPDFGAIEQIASTSNYLAMLSLKFVDFIFEIYTPLGMLSLYFSVLELTHGAVNLLRSHRATHETCP